MIHFGLINQLIRDYADLKIILLHEIRLLILYYIRRYSTKLCFSYHCKYIIQLIFTNSKSIEYLSNLAIIIEIILFSSLRSIKNRRLER